MAGTMTQRTTGPAAARLRTIRKLNELVAALDRRVPQVQRCGEAAIARAAAALRAEATSRIADLEREAAGSPVPTDVD
jgi:hypothetical protein